MSLNSMNYIHNYHLKSRAFFCENDPHLSRLAKLPYIYHSPLLEKIPSNIPGIYTLGGGRQIGKTTFLKQWMDQLLQKGVNPINIFFLTGEIIDDAKALINVISETLASMANQKQLKYLILDEITYIKDWDKGVKFLADAGTLNNVMLILTGSDLLLIREARMRFPGRRGSYDNPDFHFYPLSFAEVVKLKSNQQPSSLKDKELLLYFEQYLIHGGFLTAINEFTLKGEIGRSVYTTYSDWIRGDFLKKNKQESYLAAIIKGILIRYGSQITWNSLAKELPIDHPATIIDYIHLLERCDVCTIVEALLEDKLTGAPKKAKKVFFTDPFILQALSLWTEYEFDVKKPENLGHLVEGVALNHFKRKFPTYYIKAEGEVDIAFLKNQNFFPLEVKWTGQIRSKDLKQIRKYPNGLVLGQFENPQTNPPTKFLPRALLE